MRSARRGKRSIFFIIRSLKIRKKYLIKISQSIYRVYGRKYVGWSESGVVRIRWTHVTYLGRLASHLIDEPRLLYIMRFGKGSPSSLPPSFFLGRLFFFFPKNYFVISNMGIDSFSSGLIYRRKALKRHTRQFRILLLHPISEGNKDDHVHGSLLVSDLDYEKGAFETTSYIWGSSNLPKTTAFIDNMPMPITKSLDDFLRCLRRENEQVRIWADGICINQEDNDEKSDQVAMMADIYKSCSCVNVWLPSPARIVEKTSSGKKLARLDALLSMIADGHFHDIPGFEVDVHTGALAFREIPDFQDLWEGFLLLARSPWWTRAWTAQEVFLPPHVLFHHDATGGTCDLSLVKRAMRRFGGYSRNPHPCCAEAIEVFPVEKYAIIWEFLLQTRKIEYFREVHLGAREPDLRDCFYIVVASFADRQCYQGRDRIYSLLSAANHVYRCQRPDYTKTEEDVFTSFFECMLRESKSHLMYRLSDGMDFRLLQGLSFGPVDEVASKKPSWVPDFSQSWSLETVQAQLDRFGISRIYRASGWMKGRADVRGRELHLKGFFMDKIQVVGEAALKLHDPASFRCALAQWQLMIEEHLASQARGPSDLYKQLAMTMCGEVCGEFRTEKHRATMARKLFLSRIWNVNIVRLLVETSFQRMAWSESWRPCQPEDRPSEHDLDDLFRSGDLSCLTYKPYRNGVIACLSHRALFITEHGRIGLCVPHARPGDEVWGIFGSRVPFVLSPVQTEDQQKKLKSYHMIGDCYLHGAMSGELVQPGMKIKLI